MKSRGTFSKRMKSWDGDRIGIMERLPVKDTRPNIA